MKAGAWAVHVTTAGGVDAELAADALWQARAAAVEERPGPGGVVLVAATADGGTPDALAAAVAGRWPAEVVAVDLDAALDAWRPFARAVTVGPVTVRPPWVPPRRAPASGPASGSTGPAEGSTGRASGSSGPASGSTGPASGSTGPASGSTVPVNCPGDPALDPGGPAGAPGVDVVIDPGRAFGSGSHASTRLALGALVAAEPTRRSRVVDVGCGSGALALSALALGARDVVAVDTDPAARAATRANATHARLPGRLRITRAIGELDPPADLVMANILAPVLIALAPDIERLLAPGGVVVLTGFLAEQRDQVRAAYAGLVPVAEAAEDEWVALTLARP